MKEADLGLEKAESRWKPGTELKTTVESGSRRLIVADK